METLFYLSLVGFGLYVLFVKGLPWLASKYASYKFKGHVNINSLNLLRLTLRGITFCKSSFKFAAGEISFSPNFFSHGYSSLLIARISNVQIEMDLNQSRKVIDGNGGGSGDVKSDNSSGANLQKFVNMVCYIRFLVTFIYHDVSVTIKNPKYMDGKEGLIACLR